jgi:outer membrane immunogenic protein
MSKSLVRWTSCVAALTVALFVGQARAADLPVKSRPLAPVPAPAWSWTGFYIGAHGGGGWGTAEASLDLGSLGFPGLTGTLPLTSQGVNGYLAGVQLGYNYQMGNIVLGIEGDFSWADINGDGPCLVVITCSAKTNWIGDITGRLGFTIDRLLVYIKGGYAWADTDYSANLALGPIAISTSASDTRSGGLLGGGVEYAFMPNWTAKLEYNYIDFGNETLIFPITIPVIPLTINPAVDIDHRIHVVKVGVNYKF